MSKLNRDGLKKLRGELTGRSAERKETTIIVGMGTCGIAAGAQSTLEAFEKEIENNRLEDLSLVRTGCMGLCYAEPTVEVKTGGMPDIVYSAVDPDIAREIVSKHILGKELVEDRILDKRSVDVLKR